MAETYSEMLRRALGNTAGPAGFLLNENARLYNFLFGGGDGRTRPPESPVTEPVAPAVSENPPSSFQLAQEEAARRRAAAVAQPSTPTVTPAEASTAPVQPAAQTSPSNAFLDMLRQRVKDQIAGEDGQRIRDIGIGLLTSRSPNFFTMFGEGLQSANQAERQRLETLRQAADAERQALVQRSEEEYRREQNRLQAERLAAEAPLRAAQAEQALAYRDYLRAGGSRGGAAGRAETQRERDARMAGERAVTTENARRARAFPQEEPLTAAEAALLRDNTARRFLAAIGEAGAGLPEPPPTPRITVNPSGQTAR